jgi:hypothetical protein
MLSTANSCTCACVYMQLLRWASACEPGAWLCRDAQLPKGAPNRVQQQRHSPYQCVFDTSPSQWHFSGADWVAKMEQEPLKWWFLRDHSSFETSAKPNLSENYTGCKPTLSIFYTTVHYSHRFRYRIQRLINALFFVSFRSEYEAVPLVWLQLVLRPLQTWRRRSTCSDAGKRWPPRISSATPTLIRFAMANFPWYAIVWPNFSLENVFGLPPWVRAIG